MSGEPLRVLEGGGAPRGWEALWAKDVWRQSELPHGDLASSYSGEVFLNFERLRAAVAQGGREAVGARAPAGRHDAADDEPLPDRPVAF